MKGLRNIALQKNAKRRTCRWGMFIAIVLAVLSGMAGTVRAQSPAPKRTIVRPGRVLDVRTGQMRTNQAIVIEGEKITRVISSSDVKAAAGDTTIDLPDATLLP